MSRLATTNGLGIVEVSAPRRANWVNRQAFPGSPYTELSTGILRLGEAGTAGEGTHLLRGGFIIAPAGSDVVFVATAPMGAFFVRVASGHAPLRDSRLTGALGTVQ